MIVAAVVYGSLLMAFSLSRWFPLSLLLVALAGASMSMYMVLAQSTLQMLLPDCFRGWVMGVWGMIYNLMPLGGFQDGIVVSFLSAPVAVMLGAPSHRGFHPTGHGARPTGASLVSSGNRRCPRQSGFPSSSPLK